MPSTALRHFNQDIARTRNLFVHARSLQPASPADRVLRADLLRGAWMLGVGAMYAYFCDAYTDIVAATIISKTRYAAAVLPDFFYDLKLPIRAILEPYSKRGNWRWRMAARKMMERESVLSLHAVQQLFNKFFRERHKFFRDCLPDWILHPEGTARLFGIAGSDFARLVGDPREKAIQRARILMEQRFREIFQRRHDCIHNCDRPRVSPQPLNSPGTVIKVITDIEFLVRRCDEHIDAEFRMFLLGTGCPPAIVAMAGY